MAMRDDYELELVKAQTALALKQAQTGFWKVGIAAVAAGAIFGGLVVSFLG
ncbi:MAG TPA: hypothetical protein VFJ13_06580 [Paracoccaceae bacterium]|nr:hypothetical protein [Paracoccaceae bacterium]